MWSVTLGKNRMSYYTSTGVCYFMHMKQNTKPTLIPYAVRVWHTGYKYNHILQICIKIRVRMITNWWFFLIFVQAKLIKQKFQKNHEFIYHLIPNLNMNAAYIYICGKKPTLIHLIMIRVSVRVIVLIMCLCNKDRGCQLVSLGIGIIKLKKKIQMIIYDLNGIIFLEQNGSSIILY